MKAPDEATAATDPAWRSLMVTENGHRGGFEEQNAPPQVKEACEMVTMTGVQAIMMLGVEYPDCAETIWASFIATAINGCMKHMGPKGSATVMNRVTQSIERMVHEHGGPL